MVERIVVMSSSLVDAPALDNAEACESLVSQIAELHTSSLSDDGNWLTDNDEEADEALYLDREGKRRREEFYNAGYRDGVAAGRNDAAQDGFNQGFKESVMVGYKWGIIRGLTSAFTHVPKDLQLKLVESEDKRESFLNLSEAVNSIGNEDALKLFNDGIQQGASAERSKIIESEASTRPSGSEHSGLESYFGKMDLLLNESVQLKVNKYRVL